MRLKRLYVTVHGNRLFGPKDEAGRFYAEVYDRRRTNRVCIVRELQSDLREIQLDFNDGRKAVIRSRTLRNWIPADPLIVPSCRFRYWYSRFNIEPDDSEALGRLLIWPRSPFHKESRQAKKGFDTAFQVISVSLNRERFSMVHRISPSWECSESLESACGTFLLEQSFRFGSFRITINRDEGHADTVAAIVTGCLLLKESNA